MCVRAEEVCVCVRVYVNIYVCVCACVGKGGFPSPCVMGASTIRDLRLGLKGLNIFECTYIHQHICM